MVRLRAAFISSKLIKRSKLLLVLVIVLAMFFTTQYFFETSSSLTERPKIHFQVSGNTYEKKTRSASIVVYNLKTTPSDILTAKLKNFNSSTTPTGAVKSSLALELSAKGSCANKISQVHDGIVLFKNITIRPKLARAKVLETRLANPKEEDEFFRLEKGFFTLYCGNDTDAAKEKLHRAKTRDALASWVLAFEATNPSLSRLQGVNQTFHAGQYLAIQRIEYANVYWTVIDLLDIYITAKILRVAPEKLNILLMDAHPPTPLDPFWSVTFHRLIKVGVDRMLTESSGVVLENLVWRYPRVNSPLLDRNLQSFEHIQPFRHFVLQRFGIPSNVNSDRNCSRHKIHVLVNFRRDYHSHPRNLDGTVDRKIANEKEVVKEMNESFPNITVTATQLDRLPLKNQLELVASADIFFGMHGCAHAFPIFMTPGGAVVEIFNFDDNNWHMGKIASLSGHSHISWVIKDAKAYNRATKSTTIPAGVPTILLRKAIDKICT